MRYSDDGGRSWKGPVTLNDDGGTNGQFLAWMDVDQTNGSVAAVWYDARGTWVRTLRNGQISAGMHQVRWDGRDDAGNTVSTGVYFARLVAGEHTQTRAMVLLK